MTSKVGEFIGLLEALEDVERADLDPADDGLVVGADDRAPDRPAGIDLELEGDLPRPRRGLISAKTCLSARRAKERVGVEAPESACRSP